MKSISKIIPFILFFAFADCFAQSNDLHYEQVATAQGLSQLSVKSIVQDYQGFMWFCTDDGLNRFDGYSCKVYSYNPNDTNGIQNNLITSICEDGYKNLWVGTQGGGLYKYNREKDKFIFFDLDSAGVSKNTDLVYTLYSKGKYLWIGTREGGIVKLNLETEKVENYINSSNGLKTNFVTNICSDHNGNIWVGTSNEGLFKFSNVENKFPDIYNYFEKTQIFSATIDSDGSAWISTPNEIKKLNPKFGVVKTYSYFEKVDEKLKPGTVHYVYADTIRKTIWAAASGNLLKYDSAKDEFLPFEIDNVNIFAKSILRTLYFSNDQNILWVGSISDGAYKIDLSQSRFYNFLNDSHIGVTAPGMAILEDKEGYFWAGTFGSGLFRLDSNKNIIKAFHQIDRSKKIYVYCLMEDNEGNIWYGTVLNGLFKYDKKTKTTTAYNTQNSKLNSRGISYLYQDKEKNIWAGTHGVGLFKYNKETDDFANTNNNDELGYQISAKGITCIYNDSRGNLWIATDSKGIDKIDTKTGRFINYSNNNENGLSHNYVTTIKEDSKNNLWLGTYGGGLNKFNYETESFTYYTTNEGLPNNTVYAIEEDNSGELWISTNNGISRFNPVKEIFTNFSTQDGLAYKEFVQNAAYKTIAGEIIFGSINGFISFDPAKFSDRNIDYKIVTTGFTIGNKPVPIGNDSKLEKNIIVADKLSLNYLDNVFEFEFAALNFDMQRSLKYAYKLENFDDNWIITTPDKRFATYTNLDPGEYNFKVKVVDRSGNFSNNEASIFLTISPPFWLTWWFNLVVGSLIALGLFSIYKYRINRILELERLRVKIASDLHDEVGSTLTKVSMRAQMLEMQINGEKESKNLKRIAEQAREAVSTMQDIVWAIDSRNDGLNNLIYKMKDIAFSVLTEKNIKVNFSVSGLDSDEKLNLETRQNLYLILKEAVHNIMKHSDATEVNISITNTDKFLTMIIADNGKRYEQKEHHTGQGLRNIEMRAKKIKAICEFKNENGFIVIIKAPPIS